MCNPIEKAQSIILDLETELLQCKGVWIQIEKTNPGWEQLSDQNWQIKHARCWIHGATNILESIELDRWLFDNPPLSNTAL